MHRQRVGAVDDDAGDPVARGPVGHVGDVHGLSRGRELPVVVVLAHEQHREAHDGGQVQRLVKAALVGRAVAEEGDRHLIGAPGGAAQGGAHRDGQAAAHDPAGPQHADGEVGDVHRPALALAVAGGLAEQLGHHAVQIAALGDDVPVAAVGRDDVIVGPQRRSDPGRHRLLADVEVDESGEQPLLEKPGDLLLEAADADAAPVDAQHDLGVDPLLGRGGGHVSTAAAVTAKTCAAVTICSTSMRSSTMGHVGM